MFGGILKFLEMYIVFVNKIIKKVEESVDLMRHAATTFAESAGYFSGLRSARKQYYM